MERSTPAAPCRGSRGWTALLAKRGAERTRLTVLALSIGLTFAHPGQAQIAGGITVDSNQLFRGETISGDNPGLTFAFSVDDRSGLFAGADVSFASGPDTPRFTASSQYAGYALRKGSVSLEAGVVHRDYWRIMDDAYRPDYFEGFIGLSSNRGRVRVYVSPDYLQDGRNTYYGEIDARLAKVRSWKLTGHLGLALIPHDLTDPRSSLISYEDWGLNATRKLGSLDLSLGVAATNYPVFGERGNMRFKASLSRAF